MIELNAVQITDNNINTKKYTRLYLDDNEVNKISGLKVVNEEPDIYVNGNYYRLGTLTGQHTIEYDSKGNVSGECVIEFSTDSVAPTIVWSSNLQWLGGSAPTINANKTYQVSVVNNLAVIGEF